MRRLALFCALWSTLAFAGDVRFNVNFGNWRVGNVHESRAVVPYFPVQPYLYWFVYAVPPAPPAPPPPQVIYVEREREPQQAQIVVVQLPPTELRSAPIVPEPAPAPVALPVAAALAVPLAPRVPGPDVFHWTDEDGVVNYSTRVPADVRKKARKLAALK